LTTKRNNTPLNAGAYYFSKKFVEAGNGFLDSVVSLIK